VLPVTTDTVRLFLHVLGAVAWLGAQITLAGVLPAVRRLGPDGPAVVARRIAVVAWVGFALLLVTGVWSLLAIDVGERTIEYHVTLGLKLALVAVSAGAAVVAHAVRGTRATAVAVGAVAGGSGVAALFLGVLLSG